MKKVVLMVMVMMFMGACGEEKKATPAGPKPITKTDIKTKDQEISYALGYRLGSSFNRDYFKLDENVYWKGFKDGLNKKGFFDEKYIKKVFFDLQMRMQEATSKKLIEKSVKNKVTSSKFLAAAKKMAGVKEDKSGLLYKVVKQGKGPSPTVDDTVVVNYRGTLPDGKEFDSSYKRGKPATFPLSRMIEGWKIGIPLMKKGAKFEFWIPAKLAYGEHGAGSVIGPFQAIKFEVELLDIKKGTQSKKQKKSSKK